MGSRSRLGRGLGSLFPEINVESSQKDDTKAKEATEKTAEDAAVTNEAAKTTSSPAPVRTPLAAIFGDETESKDTSSKADTTADNHVVRQHHGRPVMPSLADSIHPSNVFFADDAKRPTPNDMARTTTVGVNQASTVETATMYEQVAVSMQKAGNSNADASHAAAANTASTDSATTGDVKKSQEVKLSGAYYTEIAVKDIGPNEHQPRTIFDEGELNELAASIKEVGVLEPIVVRKRENWEAPYELIMGERRLRAAKLAGLERIPAIVRTTSDENMLRDALLENLHRVALNPLEEAAAYEQMIEDFHITHEQLAKSVSKSRPQITNTLRLLQLPASVQKKVASGVLSAGHARALLALTDESQIEPLANKIIAEGLSVRSTEEIVALKNGAETKQRRKKKTNPWTGSDTVRQLEDQFETKVEIRGTQKKGKIEITFSSPEDLARILNLINNQNSQTGGVSSADGWV